MNPPNRWLYIDFNSYFASVEQQLDPRLRGKPVAVVPVMTETTSAIAASYEAKAFGIKTGTPIWEARQRCPGLICVLGQHEKYVEFHHRAIAEVERHLHVEKVCSIDEIACRLMSNENSHVRATQIAQAIKRGLAKNVGEYIKCSIGIAPNRYLAKVATDMHKPDGLTFLNAEDLPDKLYGLSLRDLPGIGVNMERRINRQGIWDMRQLLALDTKQMRTLWGGVWGERMWYYLRGVELPELETTRSSVGHSHVMAPSLRTPEKARYVARRLALKAASRLRRLGYRARALSLSMRIEDGPRYFTEARFESASDSMTFLHALEGMWQQLIHQAFRDRVGDAYSVTPSLRGSRNASSAFRWGEQTAENTPHPIARAIGLSPKGGASDPASRLRIKKVSVTLYHLVPEGVEQGDLFPVMSAQTQAARRRAEHLSRALDRLNQRYGRDTVLVGMLPSDGRSFSGTKIAFTRIPDAEEFLE